ncbi:hypothetical protein ACPB8Q_05575 [Methanocaldococcus indicus]|uniref:hypothetical protein n=1 Tax=Methanocaldococcus indicus TaxID=213231 RepID=UPI003C6DB7A4
MDEIDRKAVSILLNAPTVNEQELKIILRELRNLAKYKRKKENLSKHVNEILDYWASIAYKMC